MSLKRVALNTLIPNASPATFLSITWIGWLSLIIVSVFQLVIFMCGIGWISRFLNFAGPAVYVVMIVLLIAIWSQAGGQLMEGVGHLFQSKVEGWGAVSAFVGVTGTMVAYFAAVVVNYGDFSRFATSLSSMRRGNFYGLPVSLTFFTFLALFITAGAYIAFQNGEGTPLTNPAEIVGLVDNVWLTLVAAVTFFIAGLWVAVIAPMGFAKFVDTLGAILAPLYGLLVCDYYVLRKSRLYVRDMFTMSEKGVYYFTNGWNVRALVAVGCAAIFSIATVWVPVLSQTLGGFGWLIGAFLGALFHWLAMRGRIIIDPPGHVETVAAAHRSGNAHNATVTGTAGGVGDY